MHLRLAKTQAAIRATARAGDCAAEPYADNHGMTQNDTPQRKAPKATKRAPKRKMSSVDLEYCSVVPDEITPERHNELMAAYYAKEDAEGRVHGMGGAASENDVDSEMLRERLAVDRAAALAYGAEIGVALRSVAFLADVPPRARFWVAAVVRGSAATEYAGHEHNPCEALIRVVTSDRVAKAWAWIKKKTAPLEWENRAGSVLSAMWGCQQLLLQELESPLTRAERIEFDKEAREAIAKLRSAVDRSSARSVAAVLDEPLAIISSRLARGPGAKPWLLSGHVRDGETQRLRDAARRDAMCRALMQWVADELGPRVDRPMVVKRHIAALVTTWTGVGTSTTDVGRACPGAAPKTTTFLESQ